MTATHSTIAKGAAPRGAAATVALQSDEVLVKSAPAVRSTIGCVVPAHNAADTITAVLESLLEQSRLPDVIHVIVNNSTDDTASSASAFAGPHTRVIDGVEQFTELYIHDIGTAQRPGTRSGALGYGFTLVEGYDFLLAVDPNSIAAPDAIASLEEELSSDTTIGGIASISSVNCVENPTILGSLLVAGQRARTAGFTLRSILRGSTMAIAGSQFALYSMRALRTVTTETAQESPWIDESASADARLAVLLRDAGFLTRTSTRARAAVEPELDLSSFEAREVTRLIAMLELMGPTNRTTAASSPMHAALRLNTIEFVSLAVNGLTRVLFLVLIVSTVSMGSFEFSALWLVPVAVVIAFNLRTALSISNRSARDVLFALLFVPAELFLWVRLGHFLRAIAVYLATPRSDDRVLATTTDRSSTARIVISVVLAALALTAIVFTWFQLDSSIQSGIVAVGWPVLGAILALQSVTLLACTLRSHRGYRV